MSSLNKKILELGNKIKILESKLKDLTKNSQEKPPVPRSTIGNSKANGWHFVKGKWCTYAIYSD